MFNATTIQTDGRRSQRRIKQRFIMSMSLLLLLAQSVFAGPIKPYNQAEVDKLASEGRPIVLDFTATWCPTCAAQAPVIRDLMAQSKYKDLTTFTVDFDKDTELLTTYDVLVQSTLIVFSGKKEEGRSVGDTNRDDIDHLLSRVVH
jgi:thioredoxin 1